MKTLTLEAKKTLQFEAAALTDRGHRRDLNEDAVFHQTVQLDTGDRNGLFIVCDGLGGHQAGEIASHLAIESIQADLLERLSWPDSPPDDHRPHLSRPTLRRYIQAAIDRADAKIREYGQSHPYEATNMGTTITLALIYNNRSYIANVGDSRAYIWRAGQLTQITQDHSLAAVLAQLGEIEEADIVGHPQSNVLLRALGITDEIKVDLFEWELQPEDRLLLCSDGLWQAFSDTEDLAWWLGLDETPADLCWRLVLEANRRDGSDNISAIVVSVS